MVLGLSNIKKFSHFKGFVLTVKLFGHPIQGKAVQDISWQQN